MGNPCAFIRSRRMQHCALCGHFIDRQWEDQWNHFAYEQRAWCRPCNRDVPLKQLDRTEFFRARAC